MLLWAYVASAAADKRCPESESVNNNSSSRTNGDDAAPLNQLL